MSDRHDTGDNTRHIGHGTTPDIRSTLPATLPPQDPTEAKCDAIRVDYSIVPAILCAMCFIFGILYTFFGYRFFKATMFLTGFIFGSMLTYVICQEEELLPIEGKVGIALAAGVLCGIIAMLVQQIGLFSNGLNFGLFLAVWALIIMEHFYHPSTKWITIGVLFGSSIVFALLGLYFQKGVTILGTSMLGSALMVAALDYYIEMFVMVYYVWDRMKVEYSDPVCWFSWVILALWPASCFVGVITQAKVTGKGFDHHEVVQNKKARKVNLERLRMKERRDTQHSRYRHLYQIRRSNGDVVSRSYVQSINNKLSPALRNFTQVSVDPASAGCDECRATTRVLC